MKPETKQIWCPVDLSVTGYTLTLGDAHMLRDSLARTLANFVNALVDNGPFEGRAAFQDAIPGLREKIARLDAAINNSKQAYARKQLRQEVK